MRTVVFNQGFNRIESHNIIRLERAKLNRLLDSMRRVIETLVASVTRRIEAAPQRLLDVKLIWNEMQNHSIVQSLRQKIASLTDAYPQFLASVVATRRRLREKVIDALKRAEQIAHKTFVFR